MHVFFDDGNWSSGIVDERLHTDLRMESHNPELTILKCVRNFANLQIYEFWCELSFLRAGLGSFD